MPRFDNNIACAYLYPITLYGYPPDIRDTVKHIAGMARLGFTALELEGIGPSNIQYLHRYHAEIAAALAENGCTLPVLCVVLPLLGAADRAKQAGSLEWFEMGCETARLLGSKGVLDNGPLLPLEYPAHAPVRRHYGEAVLNGLSLPQGFVWEQYWESLTDTFRKACSIAAGYGLQYHLHPCEGSLVTGTDSFLHFAAAVGAPNLLFNLDTANQFYFRDNLPLCVLRLAERIGYIHISDNNGSQVEHLVPGNGRINWPAFFEALRMVGFNGCFGVDVGGAESGITDLAQAYGDTAAWLQERLTEYAIKQDA